MSSQAPLLHFHPHSPSQALVCDLWPHRRVLFLLGPAGVGKTHAALALALADCLAGRSKRVYLTRPLVPADGEDLGYLPGTVEEKVEPYLTPFRQVQARMLAGKPPRDWLVPAPLALLRGWTFEDSTAILDEGQNCSYPQLKLWLSRLGRNSRLVLCADPLQSDLAPSRRGLADFLAHLEGHPAVGVVHFDPSACLREPLLPSLLARLS